MAALAFVPLHLIDQTWLDIEAESLNPDHKAFGKLECFRTYFLYSWYIMTLRIPARTIWEDGTGLRCHEETR